MKDPLRAIMEHDTEFPEVHTTRSEDGATTAVRMKNFNGDVETAGVKTKFIPEDETEVAQPKFASHDPWLDGRVDYLDDSENLENKTKKCGKAVWILLILVSVLVCAVVCQQVVFWFRIASLETKVDDLTAKKIKTKSDAKTRSSPAHEPAPYMAPIAEQPVSSWIQDERKVDEAFRKMAHWKPQPKWISTNMKQKGITLDDVAKGFIPEHRYPWVLVGSLVETGDQVFDFWPAADFIEKINSAWKNPDKVYCIIMSVPSVLKDWLRVHEIRKQEPCSKFKKSLPDLFTAVVVPPATPGARLQFYDDVFNELDKAVNKTHGDGFVKKVVVAQQTSIADFMNCLLQLDQAFSVWPFENPHNSMAQQLLDVSELQNEVSLLKKGWKTVKNVDTENVDVGLLGDITWSESNGILKFERTTLKKYTKLKLVEKLEGINKQNDMYKLQMAAQKKSRMPGGTSMIVLIKFPKDFVDKLTEEFLDGEKDEDLDKLSDVIVSNCFYVSLVIPDDAPEGVKLRIVSNFRGMTRLINAVAGPTVKVMWADVDTNFDDNIARLIRLAELIADVTGSAWKKRFKFAAKVFLDIAGTVAKNSGMPGGALVGQIAKTAGQAIPQGK